MATDLFVFPARARRLGIWFVALTVPLSATAAWHVQGPVGHTRALLLAGMVYAVPGVALARTASRLAPPDDRNVWRLWAALFALGTISALSLSMLSVERGVEPNETWTAPRALIGIGLLIAANTAMLRRRSGHRTPLVDVVDLLMATIGLCLVPALLWGQQILASPHAWFTVPAALWLVAGVHGLCVAVVMRSRVDPSQRLTSHLGIALAATSIVSCAVNVHHGLAGFAARASLPVATHAAFVGMLMVFFLHSTQRPSIGLERLRPADQVRRHSVVAAGLLALVPAVGLALWWRQHDGWALTTAVVALASLLVLSSVRHLVSARETARLHDEIDRAATERGELLAEVMAHVDADRHRVASHLHRQAVSLYTEMASLACVLESRRDNPRAVIRAAERMRHDLGRRADGLRRVALAVKPLSPLDPASQGLAAPVKAYLENLYVDEPRPSLVVDVDPELELDWTTEAVVVRIVQEASNNVWRHARANVVRVRLGAEDDRVIVEVADDGVGASDLCAGRGIETMRSMAGFLGGELTITTAPESGTTVSAVLPVAAPPVGSRPMLHLVD